MVTLFGPAVPEPGVPLNSWGVPGGLSATG